MHDRAKLGIFTQKLADTMYICKESEVNVNNGQGQKQRKTQAK